MVGSWGQASRSRDDGGFMFLPKSIFLYKLADNPYLKPLRSELDHHI